MSEKHFLLLRCLGAFLVLLLGVAALFFAQHWAQKQLLPKVSAASANVAGEMSSLLNATQIHLVKLSKDKRMQEALAMPEWRDTTLLVRRILYEYSYIQNLDALYFMKVDESPALVKTAKAVNLPINTFQVVMDHKQQDSIMVVSVEKIASLLAVKKLVSNKRQGMDPPILALMTPVSEALKDFVPPHEARRFGVQFALLNDRGDGRVAMLDYVGTGQRKMKNLSQLETNLPLFSPTVEQGFFNLPQGGVIASMNMIPNYNNWRVVAYIPVQSLIVKLLWTKIGIALFTLSLVLAILFMPGAGAFGRLPVVRVVVRKIFPQVYKPKKARLEGLSLKAAALQEAALNEFQPEGGDGLSSADGANAHAEKLADAGFDEHGAAGEDEKSPAGSPNQRQKDSSGEGGESSPASSENSAEEGAVPLTPMQEILKKTQQARKQVEMTDNIIMYVIRQCIREKRIGLLYQPILESKTKAIYMYEVYLRLMDEDGTVLPPGQFIPVAENNNLMHELDEAVISKVIWQNFTSEEAPEKKYKFAINLSGKTLDSLSYINRLLTNTEKIPDGSIVFELRSEEIIGDRQALEFIRKCKKMGFGFGMDYFGGGDRTIRLAHKMGFAYCKLNAFKYQDLATNREKQKEIIRLAVLAKEINMPLVMERIEDKLMAEFCAKVGIDYVQGYYFAEPSAKLAEK